MPIPLHPMFSFSILSHQASLNRLPHRFPSESGSSSTPSSFQFSFRVLLYRPVLFHSNNMPKPFQFSSLYYSHSILGFIFDYQFCVSFILHCPFSFVGPYIFLNIFLPHVINIFSTLLVRLHVSAPYITVGLIIVL